MQAGRIQQQRNNDVTVPAIRTIISIELLTVLLEYIDMYTHFLKVSIYKMEILILKQLGLA